ncbi:TorF family putative porin [Methylomonas sp. EFPC3]|uniref:TorF family putative porin n=1 Tax=Methylomonas sp. EFPC3 TaxID=3021710 RepID=UPI00241671DD|nr:TorF family putative porin [Methylomonas sp. EFPC3]WFP49421.1 TorF family putative porin [Methylomonas sp. EFPC3]
MESENMVRHGLLSYVAGVGTLIASAAGAEWHGQLILASDYLYRGYSKSRGNPVVQARIDYQAPGPWFGGLGLSKVGFDDGWYRDRAEIELKPYLGWRQALGSGWQAELSAAGYVYDGKLFGKRADYAEIFGALHYRDWLSFSASVAPDAYRRGADVLNYAVNYRRDLLDNLQFSAGLGYHQAEQLLAADYFYWNAGISWFPVSYLALDLRYADVNLDDEWRFHRSQGFYPRLQDNKFLFSLSIGF